MIVQSPKHLSFAAAICSIFTGRMTPGGTPAAAAEAGAKFPDRICLCVTEIPSRSMAVSWRTGTAVNAVAEFAIATDGPGFQSSAARVLATSQTLETDLGTFHHHEATFDKLNPAKAVQALIGKGVYPSIA